MACAALDGRIAPLRGLLRERSGYREVIAARSSPAFRHAFIEHLIHRATVDLTVSGDGPDPLESAPLCDTLRRFVVGLRV